MLSAQAQRFGDKVFLRYGHEELRYGEIDELARRVATGLHARGLVAGDRVAIIAETRIDYVTAWFGAACAGCIEVPLSPYYHGEGLARLLSLVEPSVVVCTPELAHVLCDPIVATRVSSVLLLDGPERDEARAALVATGIVDVEAFDALYGFEPTPIESPRPQDIASVLFTSGTTGLPKGVRMPEAQLYFFSEQFRSYERVDDGDVYLNDKPMYTALTHFHVVYAALIAGASVALYDRFSAQLWAQRLHESSATTVVLIGEMMDFIMKQPSSALDRDNRLRCISCGPTSWAVVDRFKERFGGEAVAEGYGQTEISVPIMTPYGSDRPVGSCGLAVSDWFDVRLANPETDGEVGAGESGELQVRSNVPWIMSDGYYGNPEVTAASRRNLWWHTGDVFRRDESGWFYFVDRVGDVIRRRGVNISSKEVEDAFLSHEAIAECAAVSVDPQTGGGNEVLVALVLRGEVADEQLIRFVASKIPYYAVPRFVRRVEALPVTAIGKIRKSELRSAGVTEDTWDRISAGVTVEREDRREGDGG